MGCGVGGHQPLVFEKLSEIQGPHFANLSIGRTGGRGGGSPSTPSPCPPYRRVDAGGIGEGAGGGGGGWGQGWLKCPGSSKAKAGGL